MGKKLKILVIDDNKKLLEIIYDTLLRNNYETKCANNPNMAFRILKREGFNAIVTDIQMPEISGIELSKQIRKAHANIPIIIISGLDVSKETSEELAQINIEHVLSKPFDGNELIRLLNKLIENNDGEECFIEIEKKNVTHIGIPIERFTVSRFSEHDRYIKIRDNKYVKIANANEDLCENRLNNYRQKHVDKIYLTKQDYDEYGSRYMSMMKEISQDKKVAITKEEKIRLIAESTEIIYNQFHYEGITPKLVNQAKECIGYALNLICNDNLSFNIVHALSNQPDYLYAHSLGVSYFSSLIAKNIKITKPSSILDISLGGFFHDIGKINMDPKVYSKPSHLLSEKEKRLLRKHPEIGCETLKNSSSISSTVYSTVLQHHESCRGGGYPFGLYSHKISMPAKIVHLASDFCNLIIKNPKYRKMSPTQALTQLRKTNLKRYDKQAFAALARCFGVY